MPMHFRTDGLAGWYLTCGRVATPPPNHLMRDLWFMTSRITGLVNLNEPLPEQSGCSPGACVFNNLADHIRIRLWDGCPNLSTSGSTSRRVTLSGFQ